MSRSRDLSRPVPPTLTISISGSAAPDVSRPVRPTPTTSASASAAPDFSRSGVEPVRDAIDDLLFLPLSVPDVNSRLLLDQIRVQTDFNPRTAHLSPEARDALFTPESLAPLVVSMVEMLADGQPRGVEQSLLVRPVKGTPGVYELVAGERRFHAARLAGLKDVPVVIRELSDAEALGSAIIENAQRADLDVVGETLSGFKMMSLLTGLDTADLVRHLNALRQGQATDDHNLERRLRALYGIGVSTWSSKRSQILQLTDGERNAVAAGLVEPTVVVPLIRLGERPERQVIFRELMVSEPRMTSEQVRARVLAALKPVGPQDGYLNRVALFSKVLPKLRLLKGESAHRAETLLKELEALTG